MRQVLSLVAITVMLLLGATTVRATDDTPPPAPTEDHDPFGDGQDENGLIPDDEGEDIDEELSEGLNEQPVPEPVVVSDPIGYTDPIDSESQVPQDETDTVVSLPDTGSGPDTSDRVNNAMMGLAITIFLSLAMLWFFVGRKQ